jgi:hypothetical protein
MELKKLFFVIGIAFIINNVSAQTKTTKSDTYEAKQLKKAERKEKINQMIKQEEEGALIYQKQSAFGFKFNTDGWGGFYEHGKYKTINKTNLWWLEFGERKDKKEEKAPTMSASQGFLIVSSYVFGKQNNFYYLKAGFGQQKLIGGKGNKNGVAVSAIYGGGLSLGLLKPYYIEIQNPSTGKQEEIKYTNNDSVFLDPTIILGKGSMTKGFNEIQVVPGFHARTAIRFDYGRYNEVLSAIEVGLNADYYTKKMPMMVYTPENNFFFNAYIALVFGKRK